MSNNDMTVHDITTVGNANTSNTSYRDGMETIENRGVATTVGTPSGYGGNVDPLSRNTDTTGIDNTRSGYGGMADSGISSRNTDYQTGTTGLDTGLGSSRTTGLDSSMGSSGADFTTGNHSDYMHGERGTKLGQTVNAPAPTLDSSNPLRGSTTDATTGQETGTMNGEERGLSGFQNAPGTAGKVGENAMGAMGVGGAAVERPKEDQGLGEKIVNFFGA